MIDKCMMLKTESDKPAFPALPCLSAISFRKPATPVTSAWIEHTPFAFWLIKAVDPTIFVELGTLHGVSYFTFCEAVQLLERRTKCFAVDTWQGDDHTGLYDDEVWKHVQEINRLYTPFSTLLRKTFDEALPSFEDGTIDLLHVDGRHFYDDVKHDFLSWVPKLTNSAIVIFHDINVHERDFGVARFWRELKQQYRTFEFLHGNGLGVLSMGGDCPIEIRHLFELTDIENAAVKTAYARLGAAVSNDIELKHERSWVERLRRDIATVQKDASAINDELERVRAAFPATADAMSALELKYQAAQEKIRALHELQEQQADALNQSLSSLSKVDEIEESAAEFRNVIASQESVIAELKAEVARDAARLAGVRSKLESSLTLARNQLHHNGNVSIAGVVELKRLESRLDAMKEEKELIELDAKRYQRQLVSLRDSREKIKSSRSWKFASKVRGLVERISFIRNSSGANKRNVVGRAKAVFRAQRTVEAIENSGVFDRDWYLSENIDVARTGIDPLLHYVYYGASEGRRASPFFDTAWYLEVNEDVKASGVNPLEHYLVVGAFEGRNPSAAFDSRLYLSSYEDVRNSGVNPLVHFLNFGAKEGRHAISEENPSFKILNDGPRRAAGSACAFAFMPLISVIMPVYNVASKWLQLAVQSVESQTYPNWELCICDDGSTNPDTLAALEGIGSKNARIRVFHAPRNGGISAATNHALSKSRGDYVAFLDNDDELAPTALQIYIERLNEDREIDVFYSDEAKLDQEGVAEEPFYKPDWSPFMLNEVMYIGHLLMARKTLVDEVGGLDGTYDGVQDFELALRLSEKASKIVHVRKILYYWRRIPGSVATNSEAKPDLCIKQAAAVNAHLKRLKIGAIASPNPGFSHRVRVEPLDRNDWPKVSIVIPSKDAPHLISRCLDSIYENTSYKNFEVVVVDNGTTNIEALRALEKHPIVRIDLPGKFNFSKANNRGVDASTGEYLILLNNDTEIIQADWIEQILFLLQSENVAAVGPMLLYPDQTVQHAGVALGLRGTADHVLRGLPRDADGYFGSLACTREVSAVTFACAMLRKSDYLKVGGLSEMYQTHYQDVDLCMRLSSTGGSILYTPRAALIHHESATRGPKYDAIDRLLFLDRWGADVADGDPYSRWESETRQGGRA